MKDSTKFAFKALPLGAFLAALTVCALMLGIGISRDIEKKTQDRAQQRHLIEVQQITRCKGDGMGLSWTRDGGYKCIKITPAESIQPTKKSFIDLTECFAGKAAPANHNIFIGMFAGATATTQKCSIMIGDYTKQPKSQTDYFFNIGNKICGSLITGHRLSCKTGKEWPRIDDRPPVDLYIEGE